MKTITHIILLSFCLIIAGCKKNNKNNIDEIIVSVPEVTTSDIMNITRRSAVCGGNILSDGNTDLILRGICWSVNENPTIDDSCTSENGDKGVFKCDILNLKPETLYYVRAYATNDKGTAYGEQKVFTTLSDINLPTVNTSDVMEITATSANCGGHISSDGGSDIIECGICICTNENPSVNDSCISVNNTMKVFKVDFDNLNPETTYHVRAYAKIEKGIAYGETKSFTTLSPITLPSVETFYVTDITTTTAICKSSITNDGGSEVSARGVCWSTNENPTLTDNYTCDNNGTGDFISHITGLSASVTYYVRTYATNSIGTTYGNQQSFTTPSFAELPFSINDNKKIIFSTGNLQYNAASDTWRFAKNQYDYIGESNSNISQYYDGWIDLFGWGTSGWNCGNKYYRPYDYFCNITDYELYGPFGIHDLINEYQNSDWGVYNAIGSSPAGEWHTLSSSEWDYVLNKRKDASFLRSKGTVNGVHGLILLPDEWVTPSGVTFYNEDKRGGWNTNIYTAEDWKIMESGGAIFLPAAGYRENQMVKDNNNLGCYWSNSNFFNNCALDLTFSEYIIFNMGQGMLCRAYGLSVRLVKVY